MHPLPTLRYFAIGVNPAIIGGTRELQTLVVPVLIFVKPTLCFLLALYLAGIQLLKTGHFGATSTDGILIWKQDFQMSISLDKNPNGQVEIMNG
jgi:hypothetical protein